MNFFETIQKCDFAVCLALFSLVGAFALAIYDMARSFGAKRKS